MTATAVTPTSDLGAAQWLVDAVTTFDGTVASLMPAGYPAYLRLFHRPDQGRPDAQTPKSWAAVAKSRGTVLHAQAQWASVSGGVLDSNAGSGWTTFYDPPETGSLDPLTLPLLARHLTAHTQTPQVCHFALWEGTGKAPGSWHRFPTFRLPLRTYWLFGQAPVEAVVDYSVEFEVAGITGQAHTPEGITRLVTLGRSRRHSDSIALVQKIRDAGHVQSPSWWWPEDKAWVVHSETDYDSTLIAASMELAGALHADPDIECLRVAPTLSLLVNADSING